MEADRISVLNLSHRHSFLRAACLAVGDFEKAKIHETKARCLWLVALDRRQEAGTSGVGRLRGRAPQVKG